MYVQSDALLLSNIWTGPCLILISTRISMASVFKENRNNFIVIDMSLMVEKGIRGEIWHAIHRSPEANNKYIKYYDKNKESS